MKLLGGLVGLSLLGSLLGCSNDAAPGPGGGGTAPETAGRGGVGSGGDGAAGAASTGGGGTTAGGNEPAGGGTKTGDGGTAGRGDLPLTWSRVSGVAQKGPFLNGASVTLSELDSSLAPTGRNFQASILDDTGAFTVKNVELESSLATLRVDGFFFNEVRNASSTSQITLSAIVDLADDQAVNVNLLSHLEKGRVEQLIEEGVAFAGAKSQAQREILTIFGFEDDVTSQADDLDISTETDEAAALLAMSVILVGYRNDAALTELLANIATDLRADGKLDSAKTMTALVTHARSLEPDVIRENLEARYESLGKTVELADFEALIAQFVAAHPEVPATPLLTYPKGSFLAQLAEGEDGMDFAPNGLNDTVKVVLPGAGLPLRVVLRGAPGGFIWSYVLGTAVDVGDFMGCQQSFTLVDPNTTASVDLSLLDGSFEVLVYEGNQASPSWSRKFDVMSTEDTSSGWGECTFVE